MAIWQVDFEFIPTKDETIFVSRKSAKELSKVLPKEKSWSRQIDQYGVLDETCVQISYEESNKKKVYVVSVRLGLNTVTTNMMNAILAFAQENDFMILYAEKEYLATKENLKAIIASSAAFQFLKDPYAYLEEIGSVYDTNEKYFGEA